MTSLEYLHSRGYTHNDVKAQNLLLDSSGCDVYLVDFGLASKYKVSLVTFNEGNVNWIGWFFAFVCSTSSFL